MLTDCFCFQIYISIYSLRIYLSSTYWTNVVFLYPILETIHVENMFVAASQFTNFLTQIGFEIFKTDCTTSFSILYLRIISVSFVLKKFMEYWYSLSQGTCHFECICSKSKHQTSKNAEKAKTNTANKYIND